MGWLECGQPSGPAAGHKAKLTMPTTGDRVAVSSLASKIPVEVFSYFGIWKRFLLLLCFCFVLFSLFFLIVSMVLPIDETRPWDQKSHQNIPWFCLPASPLALPSFSHAFCSLFSKDKDQQGSYSSSFSPSSQIAQCGSASLGHSLFLDCLLSLQSFSSPSNLRTYLQSTNPIFVSSASSSPLTSIANSFIQLDSSWVHQMLPVHKGLHHFQSTCVPNNIPL